MGKHWQQEQFTVCNTARFVTMTNPACSHACPSCLNKTLRYQGTATIRFERGAHAYRWYNVPVYICSEYMCFVKSRCTEYYFITPLKVNADGRMQMIGTELHTVHLVSNMEEWLRPVLSIGAHIVHGVVYASEYHCFRCRRELAWNEPFFYHTVLQCGDCVDAHQRPRWSPKHHLNQSSATFRVQAEHVCAAMLLSYKGSVPNELIFGVLQAMYRVLDGRTKS